MQLLAACRGAVNSLLAEVVEDHIREHLVARRPRASEPRRGHRRVHRRRAQFK